MVLHPARSSIEVTATRSNDNRLSRGPLRMLCRDWLCLTSRCGVTAMQDISTQSVYQSRPGPGNSISRPGQDLVPSTQPLDRAVTPSIRIIGPATPNAATPNAATTGRMLAMRGRQALAPFHQRSLPHGPCAWIIMSPGLTRFVLSASSRRVPIEGGGLRISTRIGSDIHEVSPCCDRRSF